MMIGMQTFPKFKRELEYHRANKAPASLIMACDQLVKIVETAAKEKQAETSAATG